MADSKPTNIVDSPLLPAGTTSSTSSSTATPSSVSQLQPSPSTATGTNSSCSLLPRVSPVPDLLWHEVPSDEEIIPRQKSTSEDGEGGKGQEREDHDDDSFSDSFTDDDKEEDNSPNSSPDPESRKRKIIAAARKRTEKDVRNLEDSPQPLMTESMHPNGVRNKKRKRKMSKENPFSLIW